MLRRFRCVQIFLKNKSRLVIIQYFWTKSSELRYSNRALFNERGFGGDGSDRQEANADAHGWDHGKRLNSPEASI